MPGLEEKLEAVAKKLGIPKDKVIEALLEAALKKQSSPHSALEGLAKLSQLNLDDLLKYSFAKQLLMNGNDIDLNKIMAIVALRMVFQPDPMTIMLLQNLSKSNSNDNSNLMTQLLQQQLQQQEKLQQLMLQLLMGRKTEEAVQQITQQITQTVGQQLQQQQQQIDELREAYAKLAEEMKREIQEVMRDREQLARYMAQLAETVKKQPDTLQVLRQMITTYKELRSVFEEAARELGIKREEYVKPGGEVDWNALLNRVFDIAEKYLHGERPEMKPVEPLTSVPPQPAQQPRIEEVQSSNAEQGAASESAEAGAGGNEQA